MRNLVPYQTILAAKAGDSDAIAAIINHYTPYITKLCTQTVWEANGCESVKIDDDMRQRIEAKLMYEIVYSFDPNKLPPGETIEG